MVCKYHEGNWRLIFYIFFPFELATLPYRELRTLNQQKYPSQAQISNIDKGMNEVKREREENEPIM